VCTAGEAGYFKIVQPYRKKGGKTEKGWGDGESGGMGGGNGRIGDANWQKKNQEPAFIGGSNSGKVERGKVRTCEELLFL